MARLRARWWASVPGTHCLQRLCKPQGFCSLTAGLLLPQYCRQRSKCAHSRRQRPCPSPSQKPQWPCVIPLAAPISDRPRLSYKVLRSSCFASGSKGALQSCFSLYLPGNFFPYLIESLGQFEPKNELFYSGVVSSFSNINRFYYIIYVNCIN